MRKHVLFAVAASATFGFTSLKAQNTFPSSGNVGIGTTSPISKLHIIDGVNTGGGYYKPIRIYNPNLATGEHVQLAFGKANSSYNQGEINFNLAGGAGSANNTLSFGLYGNPTILTIKGNGNVGVGITTPLQKLDVQGNVQLSGDIYNLGNRLIHNTGYLNLVIGEGSGTSLVETASGSVYNTVLGYSALQSCTTCKDNIAIGHYTLQANTGNDNTAVGVRALTSNSTGNNNSAYGANSLNANSSGNDNTAIGDNALSSNMTGSFNTANGVGALISNKTGDLNTAIGDASLSNNTTNNNTANGYASLFSNTTGSNNTGIGMYALYFNTTNSYNAALGFSAGDNSYYYSQATFLGANTTALDNLTNITVVGYGAQATATNQVMLGNTSVTSVMAAGPHVIYSDGRFKKDIKEEVPGLEFINKLRPVTYHYKIHDLNTHLRGNTSTAARHEGENKGGDERALQEAKQKEEEGIKAKEAILYTGFVAQEVEDAAKKINYDFSGIHKPQSDKDVYGLSYAEFVVPLVKAVQEQQQQIEQLKTENADVKRDIAELKAMMIGKSNNISVSSAYLEAPAPNPSSGNTLIKYHVPTNAGSAKLVITDVKGSVIKTVNLSSRGMGQLNLSTDTLAAGAYTCTLYVDNVQTDSKTMIVSR